MTLKVSERIAMEGPRSMSDGELLNVIARCADRTNAELRDLAWKTPGQLVQMGYTQRQANMLAAVFEIGRRGAWEPPRRGERCLDPRAVYELMRSEAREDVESFHVVLLDVRGRLLGKRRVAQGSLTQCPVSPRDTMRPAVSEGAHSIVLVHNHPSGDPSPSADDMDLTERLRAAADLVGVLCRDHVIVASGGYYSFVEAGRWHRG